MYTVLECVLHSFCTQQQHICLVSYYLISVSEKIKPFGSKLASEEHSLVLIGKPQPPKLLICYSSIDGPAHVRVVMELAAFLQQHMAVQVKSTTEKPLQYNSKKY